MGFQCPECVAQAGRAIKVGRTLAGGRVHGDPVLVTKVLLAVNVVLFLAQQVTGDSLTQRFWLMGAPVATGEWWRLISSAFLHVSVTHLLFNMLALWFVGGTIEPRLGRARYLTVYLVSALAGSVLSYAVDPVFSPSVGASGAVFGLFGAFFVLALRLRMDVRGVIAIIAINLVIGFIPGTGINWRAHVGGLIAGAILTAVMVYTPQAKRVLAAVVATVAIVAVCIGVTVWRTNVIQSCVDATQLTSQCSSLIQ